MAQELPQFVSVQEFARMMSVPPKNIYKRIRTGEVDAVRVGRQYRIDPAVAVQQLMHRPRVSLNLDQGADMREQAKALFG